MTSISVKDASLVYPIYHHGTRSLKRALMDMTVGGNIATSGGTMMIRALDGISFDLQETDRLGLLGHNGAGKTSLLRLLAGIYEATSGQVRSSGRIVSLFDLSMGMDPELTGYDNIYMRGYLLGFSKREIDVLIPDIEAFTGLGNYLDMPMRAYSTGMMLRLAFAISTSVEPDILLMDEWMSTGDAWFVKKAEDRLHGLIARSRILVLASHAPDLVSHVCNKAMILEHGCVKAFGPVKEIVEQYRMSAGL
jgi:ABC-type polysaccharide/polyol phosphate transport system ATPase subunit